MQNYQVLILSAALVQEWENITKQPKSLNEIRQKIIEMIFEKIITFGY